MAPTKVKPRKTVEDYLRLPDGTRAELIEGEVYISPSPKLRHQRAVETLYRLLHAFCQGRRAGEVHVAPLDVHLPSGDVIQPDVIFVSESNRAILKDWIRGVPDLLIEVISPESAERDRIVKRRLYEQNGVREYWLADPEAPAVEVLVLSATVYAPHGYFEEGDRVTSAVLPGLSLGAGEIVG